MGDRFKAALVIGMAAMVLALGAIFGLVRITVTVGMERYYWAFNSVVCIVALSVMVITTKWDSING